MNKNKIYAISFLIITFITILLFSYISSRSKKNEEVRRDAFYNEWSVENHEALARSALESYIFSDINESKETKINRLLKYFTADSPVLLEQAENKYNKIVGNVLTFTPCEEQEGEDLCLIATSINKYYLNKETFQKELKYWITIKKIGNEFKVYDAGIWDY